MSYFMKHGNWHYVIVYEYTSESHEFLLRNGWGSTKNLQSLKRTVFYTFRRYFEISALRENGNQPQRSVRQQLKKSGRLAISGRKYSPCPSFRIF